jgi:hypothetical protein
MLSRVFRRQERTPKSRPFSEFIPFKETSIAAKAAGLSIGDYLERRRATGSRTALDETMDGLESRGVFDVPIARVCEVGPGSGRYLERIIARARPQHYEIYETSKEWREWLMGRHTLVARACNGKSLAETESRSVDLVQAHKVFPGLPLLTTISYLREMARVVRDGGWVVFDVMTEACFRPEHLEAWFGVNPWEWDWSPMMVAQNYVVSLLAEQGLSLIGSFPVPLFPAITECMVFRRLPTSVVLTAT